MNNRVDIRGLIFIALLALALAGILIARSCEETVFPPEHDYYDE